MRPSRLELVVLLACVVVVAIGIEAINWAWGDLLPDRSPPQEGSGYGKMRGAMGEFQSILCLLGTWVYPACVVAGWGFVKRGRNEKTRQRRWGLFACAALCGAILVRFFYLGVFTSGWGQFLG